MKVSRADGQLLAVALLNRHHHVKATVTTTDRLSDVLEIRAQIDVVCRFRRQRVLHGGQSGLPFRIGNSPLIMVPRLRGWCSPLRFDCPLSRRHEIYLILRV